jgi:hypothetical protein
MLGTPAADKSQGIVEAAHDVAEQRPLLIKAVWS